MSKTDDGVTPFLVHTEPSKGPQLVFNQVELRDYFAAAEKLEDLDETVIFDIAVALAGPIPTGNWRTNTVEWIKWNAKWRAEVRFIRADAMLKAREVKQ